MSGREWKPGDVAVITYGSGEFTDTALRCDPNGWAVAGGDVREGYVTDARPLVVIDPEDREQVEQLTRAYWRTDDDVPTQAGIDNMQKVLREFANPTPPKPEAYAHVASRADGDITTALCGKVWKPGADVTVVGECPECKSLAGEWIA